MNCRNARARNRRRSRTATIKAAVESSRDTQFSRSTIIHRAPPVRDVAIQPQPPSAAAQPHPAIVKTALSRHSRPSVRISGRERLRWSP